MLIFQLLNLRVVTTYHLVPNMPVDEASSEPTVALVTKSLPVALLATCRQIHYEAIPTLAPLLEMLKIEPARFIIIGEEHMHQVAVSLFHSTLWNSIRREIFHSTAAHKFGKHREGLSSHALPYFGRRIFPEDTEHGELVAFIDKCAQWLSPQHPGQQKLARYEKFVFAVRTPAELN
jgi:hypothetical protein